MLYLLIALLPLSIGLMSRVWFLWLLPPVRFLNKGAKWLDTDVISVPAGTPLTVAKIRKHEECGDKIVVAHHLASWTLDLQRTIFWTLGINSALSLLMVVGAIILGDIGIVNHKSSISEILGPAITSKTFLISFIGTATTIYIFARLVADQAHKYRTVIHSARPARQSMVARIRRRFGAT